MEKERNKKSIEWWLKLKSKKQIAQWCTLPVRREKKKEKKSNDYQQQFDHCKQLRTTPNEKGHGDASRETTKGHLHPLGDITSADWMAWMPLTCWGVSSSLQ
jgi:hypothetical protein